MFQNRRRKDAEFLEKEFSPVLSATDIPKLSKCSIYKQLALMGTVHDAILLQHFVLVMSVKWSTIPPKLFECVIMKMKKGEIMRRRVFVRIIPIAFGLLSIVSTNAHAVTITATQLNAAYEANAVAADLQYGEKELTVTGTIFLVRPSNDRGSLRVALVTGTPLSPVVCTFNVDQGSRLAKLQRRQKVTITGTCIGYAIEGEPLVCLDECKIQ